jgi:hypothetical protein
VGQNLTRDDLRLIIEISIGNNQPFPVIAALNFLKIQNFAYFDLSLARYLSSISYRFPSPIGELQLSDRQLGMMLQARSARLTLRIES